MGIEINEFRNLLDDSFKAVEAHKTLSEYLACLEVYMASVEPMLNQYEHHQGENINKIELESRFRHESVLLDSITRILAANTTQPNNSFWPMYESSSPYKWIRHLDDLGKNQQFAQICQDTDLIDIPTIIQMCTEYLSEVTERHLGEFYTPLSIATHLVELSGLCPENIMSKHKIIDPACGGGIVLWLIFKQFLEAEDTERMEVELAVNLLSNSIYGYDVQPFAITLTRTILYFEFLRSFPDYAKSSVHLLPNIRLQDTLATYEEHWKETTQFSSQHVVGFDFIVANPPYMPVKKRQLTFISRYDDVLYGYPNLYQLFLWWAIRAANDGARISFLIPQSMLTGVYYKKLRAKIEGSTVIRSITRLIDRIGVVGKVDVQLMALSLEKGSARTRFQVVDIKVARNGTQIYDAVPLPVAYESVIKKIKQHPTFWIVSNNQIDYEISERLDDRFGLLEDKEHMLSIGNGGFVWNQNKAYLTSEPKEGDIPLVSAASVFVYGFEFPYIGSHATHSRPFVTPDENVSYKVHSGHRILIQRITPKKAGRRLVASILPDWFIERFKEYYLENHVNYIASSENDLHQLYGLLGWLNSDLLNFVFQLRNGSALVSIHELKLLPSSVSLNLQLAREAKRIIHSSQNEQPNIIRELNQFIYEYIGLNVSQRERIETVLAWKERS